MAFFSFDSFKKGAGKKRAASDSESESSEPKPKAASAAPPVAKAQDVKETPSELLAVAKELQTTAELARRFAVATLRQWKQQGDGALGEAPDMSSLEPLLDLLLAKALDEKEEEHMKQCCLQSLEGRRDCIMQDWGTVVETFVGPKELHRPHPWKQDLGHWRPIVYLQR
ncbi:unnamed protein product [Durusdinium trenchii]|uniref:Uncharacterized protein n=2 Tax=Durusdinium trenchii TaxID=1381693 RepID=A0ABP0S457_9DINO